MSNQYFISKIVAFVCQDMKKSDYLKIKHLQLQINIGTIFFLMQYYLWTELKTILL